MRRRWLAWAVIVTMTSGCDNVAWGGVDMHLEPPVSRAELVPSRGGDEDVEEEDSIALPALPEGPLLLAGTRDGSSATLVVVGEVRGETVAPLPSEEEAPGYRELLTGELLPPGTELTLFSEGVRVGRLVTSETGVDERFCFPRVSVTGTVELLPSAVGTQRLIALPRTTVEERPYAPFRSASLGGAERQASLDLASAAIVTSGAPWPPSLLEARADVQAFQLRDQEDPALAATFLYQDRLTVGEPVGPRAYALFVLGTPDAPGSGLGYHWYRRVDEEGKGAPRYFGHLDWDGDGDSEVLLDVLGTETRWFAGLARTDGSWSRSFQDACGTGSPAPGG